MKNPLYQCNMFAKDHKYGKVPGRVSCVDCEEYELNEDLAAEDGLVCGGTMFFLIEKKL